MPLISDEISYFNQGLAFANFQKDTIQSGYLDNQSFSWITAKYPLGTAAFLALFIFIFGNKFALISGLLYLAISYLLLLKCLSKLRLPLEGSFLFFLFLPLLFISRSFMSEMPSLLLLSLFYFLYFKKRRDWSIHLSLGFLAGISFWFREMNAVICGVFLLFRFYEYRSSFLPLLFSGTLGLSIRFLSALAVFGTAFYVKESAPFGLAYISNNALVYGLILLVLIPLGLVHIFSYRGPHWKAILSSSILYIFLHLCYEYNAVSYSGLTKALIVNGRFFIPIIPLWCICLAYFIKHSKWYNKPLQIMLLSAALLVPAISHAYAWNIGKKHQPISQHIFEKYKDTLLLFDTTGFTSSQRYLNPFHGNLNKVLSLSSLKEKAVQDFIINNPTPTYIFLSHRFENEEKKILADKDWEILNDLPASFQLVKEEELVSGDGAIIQIWRLTYSE